MRSHHSSRSPSDQARNAARPTKDDTLEARIGKRIAVQPNGCWLFRGKLDQYGVFTIYVAGERYSIAVYRWIYEMANGPIPARHHVHHECETPGCCNPQHLIALTPAEHARRHRDLRRSAA